MAQVDAANAHEKAGSTMYEDARPLIGAFDADAWPRPEWKPSRVTELEAVSYLLLPPHA